MAMPGRLATAAPLRARAQATPTPRSEEHTSELQSPCNLVCRLLLEKKKFQLHFDAAREKLLPGSEIVSEVWAPFPNTADFTSHITKTVAAKPDIVVTSMWCGMYVSFYKQALGHGLFRRARLAGNINFGVVPQAIGKDHPEGALAGVHSNYHFTYAPPGASAANKRFVDAYQKRWNEYPSYAAEAAYTGLYFFKNAVEKATKQAV